MDTQQMRRGQLTLSRSMTGLQQVETEEDSQQNSQQRPMSGSELSPGQGPCEQNLVFSL